MMNVLPDEALRSLSRVFYARLVFAGAILLTVVALVAAIALAPSYFALQANLGATNLVPKQSGSVSQQDRTDISRTQALISQLKPIISASSSPSLAITAALSLRPAGVIIDHIIYTPGITGAITLSGSAHSRETINSYREALLQNTRFKSVSVPVDALVGSEGGHFTITLSGDF